jgi:hypothetical protein
MATIGLDRLYYAKITENENGEETYDTPVPLAKAITAELSVVISRLGILRKRNRADACENAALFAHFSLPCLSSLYALTEARITSPFSAKPSLSLTGLVEIISTKVLIFPKPIFTPSNPGRAATKG